MKLNEAIEVLEKVKHWIDYGAGELEPTANTVIEAIDTVVEYCEQKTYTTEDIFGFIKWGFTKPGYMRNYFNYFHGNTKGFFTIPELLKKWEDWKAQQGKEETK